MSTFPERVAFISDLEGLGGAGIAASRLAIGLDRAGVRVTRLTNNPNRSPLGEPIRWTSRYAGLPRELEIAVNALRRVSPAAARKLGFEYSARALRRELARERFDLIHVHGIHASHWNHATLAQVDPGLPTVWTFHDCWSFSPEAQLYTDLDGNTVRLKPDGADREAAMKRRLAYFDSRKRCALVANSRWTAEQARRLLDREVSVIPCGIDVEVFAPIDRQAARKALRIPDDAFVVGFSAANREEPLKGFNVLRSAMRELKAPTHLLAIGEGPLGDELLGQSQVHYLGHVLNPALLAVIYAAANVFVVPSLAEALGMAGMEVISCGVPVIGSDTGGIPDVVREGETGWLFPRGDPAALLERLDWLAGDPARADALAASCRHHARENWSLDRQAESYLRVYRSLR